MIYAINYANKKWLSAQKLNSRTAKKYGADKIISYTDKDIDKEFYEKNKHILIQKRGNGYWLWKPYIIKKTLELMNNDDYLIYVDSGSCYVNKINFLIEKMEEDKNDIMCFGLNYPEKKYTKRDAFILMDCDTKKFTESVQILATYMVIKKTKRTINIINEWLKYAQDYRIITDSPNECGKENYNEFIENRHDQTIFSLVCKKYNCKIYVDPVRDSNDYPKIFEQHRMFWASNTFVLKISKVVFPKIRPILLKIKNKLLH